MLFIHCFSEVFGWRNMVLDLWVVHQVLFDVVENIAPCAIETVRLLLDTHVRPTNRKIVVDFVIAKITMLDDIAGHHVALT